MKTLRKTIAVICALLVMVSPVGTISASAEEGVVNVTATISEPDNGAAVSLPSIVAIDDSFCIVEGISCEKYDSAWNSYSAATYVDGKYRFSFIISGSNVTASTKVYLNGDMCTTSFDGVKLQAFSKEYTVHTHDFSVENESSAYLAKEATCSQKATYYYSCACGAKGTATFERDYAPTNHKGAVHTWNASTDKRDKDYHWYVCSDCKAELTDAKEAHTWDSGTVTKKETVFAKGEKTYKCTRCNLEKKEEIPAITSGIENHSSPYSEYGSKDVRVYAYKLGTTVNSTGYDSLGNTLYYSKDFYFKNDYIYITNRYMRKIYGRVNVCIDSGDKHHIIPVDGLKDSPTATVMGEMSYLSSADRATSAIDAEKNSLVQNRDFTIGDGKIEFTKAYLDTFGGTRKVTFVIDGFTYNVTAKGNKILKELNSSYFSLQFDKVVYDGKLKVPKLYSSAFEKDKDYKVTYYNPSSKSVGEYTIKIEGIGDCTGTVYLYYSITPSKTSIKSLDGKKSSIKVSWAKRTSNVTGYQIQYSKKSSMNDATTKTVSDNERTKKTISGLTSNTRYYVRIRTYKTVNGSKVYSQWSSKRTVKTCGYYY